MKNAFLLITLAFVFQSCLGNSEKIEKLTIKQVESNLTYKISANENVDHKSWDSLLKKYVDENGFVDYKGFLNDREKLTNYLEYLSLNTPDSNWSVQEKLAYYINLYNAATVELILENYPIKSIKDINNPWGKSIIKLGDEKNSLEDLEHSILRKMNEPRIHFAINCASYSCPNLLNEAFVASKIEEQLENVSYSFINGNKNDITETNPKISKIFKWFKKDFKIGGRDNLIGFINKYSSTKIDSDADIDFKDYNWSLNEKK